MRYIVAIIKSMRPVQWIKNLFVFAGLIFSQEFFDIHKVLLSFAAFAIFCLLASGVYIFNDIVDLPADRQHPTKKFRPLPSGEIPVWLAAVFAIVFVGSGLLWAFDLDSGLGIVAATYILLQILYSFALKKLVIVDILVVASGFLLRAAAGAVVIDVVISSWLLLCTSLLALFLVTAKRRQELARIVSNNSNFTRDVLRNYSLPFLDELILIEIASTITAYSLYVFSPETAARFGTAYLGLSLPFVLYGLFRYLFLVKVMSKGESPEKLVVSDPPFIINLLLWILIIIVIIYFK
ncbi:decaprenyl-phosphate phosphoribosyltransferase [bacterium]|nr:decaprenyl-phosphate phosphoribosyltransferase [bacterium]